MRMQAPIFNERLTCCLTSAFSFQLGEASRTTQAPAAGSQHLHLAGLLTFTLVSFVRRKHAHAAAARLRKSSASDPCVVTDGVVTIDEDRTIVLFNRAAEAMFGVEAVDALGSSIDRFVEHVSITFNPHGGDAAPAASVPGSLQALTGRRPDGTSFPIEASFSRLQVQREVLTTIVLRDITARISAYAERRAHESLEASSKAKTEFLSRMSHELRTPLNAVIGFSKLLRLDTAKPLSADQLDRVQHVENAGAHLLALVNDVLDLSRIESGEMSVLVRRRLR